MSTVVSISSASHPLLVRLRKRREHPGGYRQQGDVLIEGEHLSQTYLQRALPSPTHALICDQAWHNPVLKNMALAAPTVLVLPEKLMRTLSTLELPAPVALLVPVPVSPIPCPTMPSIILDRLQDPGNVGSILRSAAAFGFKQVIAMKGTCALWASKVVRAGMGAHFDLQLIEGVQMSTLEHLQLPLLATSSHANQAVHAFQLPWPCAWVLGHEGQGIEGALLERCTHLLRIAQPGGQESLNVATAAAICLYESVRQRGN